MATLALPERGAHGLWTPRPAKVLAVREEIAPDAATKRVVTLSVERADLDYLPGQFLQVTVFGAGEVPISISSAHGLPGALYITVRAAGTVSQMLTGLRPGAVVGLRGPCGNGFRLEEHEGRDLVFVAGGIGLAPLTIGLLMATGWVLALPLVEHPASILLVPATIVFMLKTRRSPLWMIAVGALVGASGGA